MPKDKLKFTEPHLCTGYSENEAVLVALSGGADSSALLHRLCEYRKKTNCRLCAAHVNHGIRGEEYGFEADRDEAFCIRICDMLGVELFVERINIPELVKSSGQSLETESRDQRYAFFTRVMQQQGIKILATAHNADDNLETQIFNLSRGCGIDGLAGIPQVRPICEINGGVIIRPLLYSGKSEIIEYCRNNNVEFVTDSTNFEDDCTRNVLRHKIIPELKKVFPSIHRASQRLHNSATEDSDFILYEARKYLEDENGMINAKKLSALHPSLVKRVLILAFSQISDASLEAVHLDALISLVKTQKNGSSVSLPDKKQATVADGVLLFGNDTKGSSKAAADYKMSLKLGFNIIENTPFAVELSNDGDQHSRSHEGYALYAAAAVSEDVSASLYAQNRSAGESIRDGGVNKKIKKLMCDKHVPLYDRDMLPIIRYGNEIIFVPLCAVSDSAKVKKQEQKALAQIKIYKRSSEE